MEIVSTPYAKQSGLTEKDYLNDKSANKVKKSNKINNFIFTPVTKNNNDDVKNNNNQNVFNCNCIGKDSYKNTEGITIINKNSSDNNEIHTYSTTYGKSSDKNETINNKTTNSKKPKNVTNFDEKDLIKENKRINSLNSISKRKTNEKTNPNIILEKNKANNILNESKKEKDKLCLDLEVLNSWNLPIGLQLHIDEFGLKNSIRNKGDGITYFGFQTEDSLNTEPYIDYLLGPKDQEYDEQFVGKHFQIRFDNETKKYYIKDLGNGFGTFIKLNNEEKIKDNLLINIGETYIVFSFNNENEKELMIKIFTGDEQCNSYLFNMDNQTCIIIGRDSSLCDVIVEDKMLSRIHCCINYKDNGKNEKGWYIKDGNMEGKKSTNDTWFYSAEETLIYDKMIFKTNHILFKCIYK